MIVSTVLPMVNPRVYSISGHLFTLNRITSSRQRCRRSLTSYELSGDRFWKRLREGGSVMLPNQIIHFKNAYFTSNICSVNELSSLHFVLSRDEPFPLHLRGFPAISRVFAKTLNVNKRPRLHPHPHLHLHPMATLHHVHIPLPLQRLQIWLMSIFNGAASGFAVTILRARKVHGAGARWRREGAKSPRPLIRFGQTAR